MRIIKVNLSDDEDRVFNEYARLKNTDLPTLMKETLLEKIEDEYDLKAILDYEERLKNNEEEYHSLDEVKKETIRP